MRWMGRKCKSCFHCWVSCIQCWAVLKNTWPVYQAVTPPACDPWTMSPVPASVQVSEGSLRYVQSCTDSCSCFGLLWILKDQKFHFYCVLATCREDNYCNYWTYEENLEIDDDQRCSLMTSCEKTSVAPYPVLTTSGGQDCKPEPVKRRKCSGCPQERPFCHGRAVFTCGV